MLHGYLNLEPIFSNNKIVPVLVSNDVDNAINIANALLSSGINALEITLRTANALSIIQSISKALPNMIVGAGTILNADQYHTAISHGAKFIVSPGLTSELVQVATEYQTPFLPGAITPTEVMIAINYGFRYLKYFPAESNNAYKVLQDYAKVFTGIKFCPTGGINNNNVKQYLSLSNVAAIGTSAMFADLDKHGVGSISTHTQSLLSDLT